MDTETLDKLYLELSQFTTAKTKREIELEEAIRAALKIRRLWLPGKIEICENKTELQALQKMHNIFMELVDYDISD